MDRRTFVKLLGGGTAGMALSGCQTLGISSHPRTPRPITIIALPDTQHYSRAFPELFKAQTQWIRDNKDELDIFLVIHEGDITDNNNEQEWDNAIDAISVLDGVVPYCLNTGNHDMPGWGAEREVTLFRDYFPLKNYSGLPWFGGTWKQGLENAWWQFERDGIQYMVLCLEFGPREEVVVWANQVLKEHPQHRVILATHCYMYSDETRVGENDDWNPHDYGCCGNDGEELWHKLVRKHENIFLVLSGHILHDGLGRLTSTNDFGSPVHQILANYQMLPRGGEGYLRIMRIDPAANQIEVKTFSPVLNEYATDPQNEFVLKNAFRPGFFQT